MDLKKTFDIIRASRKYLMGMVNDFSLDQLNAIPEGYNNNLIWHMGHVVATQQLLTYRNADLDVLVDEDFISRYRTGTKPQGSVLQSEREQVLGFLNEHIDKLEHDYYAGAFKIYNSFASRTYQGLTISSIEEAIEFVLFHEGLHMGYVMSMRHSL